MQLQNCPSPAPGLWKKFTGKGDRQRRLMELTGSLDPLGKRMTAAARHSPSAGLPDEIFSIMNLEGR